MRFAVILTCVILVSCNSVSRNNNTSDELWQSGNSYAELFALSDSGSYKRLDIKSPWQGASDIVFTYYLLEEDAVLPYNIPDNQRIIIPVSRAVCMSTSHIAMLDALAESSGIVGASGLDYISNKLVRDGINRGEVKEIGYDSNLNSELIAGLKPDIVFVYGIGAESSGYMAKLKEAGVKTMYICDYMELHPLARTEWLKVFGALYGKQARSERIIDSICQNYEATRMYISSNLTLKPEVMLGLPYKDKWFVSPGNSYISKLISDAGASYLWDDIDADESMPLSIESVYVKGMNADYWLNTGIAQSSRELIGVDSRFGDLPPVKNGKIYNNNARLNSMGGNDYWESGVMSPDIILHDLASILQPEIIIDHSLVYYRKLK